MKILILLFLSMLLSGCSSPQEAASPPTAAELNTTIAQPFDPVPRDALDAMIQTMTLEERVGQLFLARCDSERALEDIRNYHLGGFVLFAVDFENKTPDTLFETIASYQFTAKYPMLIAVDEEGGAVTRISRYKAFRDKPFPSPRLLYREGGLDAVLVCEKEKCILLRENGINVNLGPVCDMTTDPSAFMYQRSLGQDTQTTCAYISDVVRLMQNHRVGSVLKHFPGYGNNADTHTGIAADSRSLSELEEQDLLPFASGIRAGCGGILVSHTIVECLDAALPASLSPAVHEYLRTNLGFAGVIITDDLAMQAITDLYGAGEAAVLAVLAGNDLLCSTEYVVQYQAVLAAVESGRIRENILNSAVRNILEWKTELGLMD